MYLEIIINTDNDAFKDENLGSEIARILTKYASDINDVSDPESLETIINDSNGNTVGVVQLSTTIP